MTSNQLLSLINSYIVLLRFHQLIFAFSIESDLIQKISNALGQCPTQGALNYIDKSNHKVQVPNHSDIIACKTEFSSPQVHAPHTRDNRYPPMSTRVVHKNLIYSPVGRFSIFGGNPSRYVSRTLITNIIIPTQHSQPATSTMDRANIPPQMRMAIRHPVVTTRQLLPRDSAMINLEIIELDVARRPIHISFLVLSREATKSEKDSGSLELPICRATWDFPDPDTFYDVLDQVVNRLEPAHKRPGALITAAAAPESMGLCVIRIKNNFGYGIDFIRRAIRGATQGGTILETFLLAAFLPPISIHLEQPWTRGMRRYKRLNLKHTHDFNKCNYIKAAIHGQCQGCPVQPAPATTNVGRRGAAGRNGGVGLKRDITITNLFIAYSSPSNIKILINPFLNISPSNCLSVVVRRQSKLRNSSCTNVGLANSRLQRDHPTEGDTPPSTRNNRGLKIEQQTKVKSAFILLIFPHLYQFLHKSRSSHRQRYRSNPKQRTGVGLPHQQPTPQHHRRQSASNISNKEEGMPTPPRVESLADTANILLEVIQILINPLCLALTKIPNIIACTQKTIFSRQTLAITVQIYHQESLNTTTRPLSSTPRTKLTDSEKERPADYIRVQELVPTRGRLSRDLIIWRPKYPRRRQSRKPVGTQVRETNPPLVS